MRVTPGRQGRRTNAVPHAMRDFWLRINLSRIILVFTYLQRVQVNVVKRAVDARCQIMRHLDTPLVLSLSHARSFVKLTETPNERFCRSVHSCSFLSFLQLLLPLYLSVSPSFALSFRYGLSLARDTLADKNTRVEKRKSAQLADSLLAPAHTREH